MIRDRIRKEIASSHIYVYAEFNFYTLNLSEWLQDMKLNTFKEELKCKESQRWLNLVIDSMVKNHECSLVRLPKKQRVIECKFLDQGSSISWA